MSGIGTKTEGESPTKTRWTLMWLILIPILGLAAGVGITIAFGLNQTPYSNVIVNLVYTAAVIGVLQLVKFSRQELGLQVIERKLGGHVILSMLILAVYFIYYLFAIRITALKPFSVEIAWGLLANLLVVFAEEIHFRGLLYGYFEKRYSPTAALILTSLLFGLFHAQQGIGGMIAKISTGWLWGSVRYASGMIFLIIIPVHYAYNSVWLLFMGNWGNPPVWTQYAVVGAEFLLGLMIVYITNKRSKSSKENQ